MGLKFIPSRAEINVYCT